MIYFLLIIKLTQKYSNFYFLIFFYMRNFSETILPIAYPGITAECIPGTKNIYEITWNCGGFSVMLWNLGDNPRLDAQIEKVLRNIANTHKQIIFIFDDRVIVSKKSQLEELFSGIFWDGNYAFAGVKITETENNPINGLRINRTGIVNENELIEKIATMPDAVVLSSIPLSDPRIVNLNEKISTKNLMWHFSAKTLQLLNFNASKENQTLIAPEMMGYLGRANNADELTKIFKNNDGPFVIKELEASAGGTNVNFILTNEQKQKILHDFHHPILVFKFFESSHLISEKGKHPMQFRPMIANNGEFMGGSLKIPFTPIPEKISTGTGKQAFRNQNEALNTSSGLTHSIMFDDTWYPLVGYISDKKGYDILFGDAVMKFLEKYSLENSKKSLDWEQIIRLNEDILPLVRNIQVATNKYLNLL